MQKATCIAVLLVFSLILGSGPALARSVYVTDTFEITMRTGASNENRIIAMLPSGTQLEVLDEGEEWVQVMTPGGKEGWVLKRFVQENAPSAVLVDRLQRENTRLKEAAQEGTSKAAEFRTQNRDLDQQLSQTTRELDRLQKQYASLQADAKDVVDLKNRFQQTASELETATSEKKQLAQENAELRSEARMRWFLAGAGVVGGAWLIGFIMGRVQRKSRRSSLYS